MRFLLAFAFVILGWCSALYGQPDAPPPSPASPNSTLAQPAAVDADEARLRDALGGWADRLRDAEGSLDASNPAVQNYQALESALRAIDEKRTEAARLEQSRLEAPARLQAIQVELDQPPGEVRIEVPADATLVQLEQRLAEARAELETARQQVNDLAAEKSQRESVIQDAPATLARLRQELAGIVTDLSATGTDIPGTDNEVARSERMLLLARRLELQQEINRVEKQVASIEARRALLPKRQDLAARRVGEAEKRVAAWDQAVISMRQAQAEEARRQAEELRRRAARQHPVLSAYAEENTQLAGELNDLQAAINEQSPITRRDQVAQRAVSLRQTLDALKKRVETLGLDDATGLALRREYARIGDLEKVQREAEAVRDRRQEIEYRIQEIQGQQDDLRDEPRSLDALIADVESDATPIENRDDLTSVARELITARKDLLNKLDAQLENRGQELTQLQDAYSRSLIPVLREATEYIEIRILWVRSVAGDPVPSARDTSEALEWLVSPAGWGSSIRASWAALRYEWLEFVSIASGLLLLLVIRLRAPARLAYLNEKTRSFRTDRFALTVRALIVTVLMSLPIPMLLRAIAWFLERPGAANELALAVSGGLRAASGLLFALILARNVLRDDGIGEKHFNWHNTGVRTIRRHLRWFVPIVTTLWGAVITLDLQSVSSAYGDSLGRLCFIGAMAALSLFLALILRPNGAVLGPVIEEHQGRWLERLSLLWYSAAVGVPVVLIGLALAKYYYTALRLQHLIFATLWLIGILVVAVALTGRWLYITRRRLAIESAKRKREQARAAAAAAEGDAGAPGSTSNLPASGGPPSPPSEQMEVDIPALDAQMRQAVRTGVGLAFLIGMLLIWSEVLPALRMLDRQQLWPSISYENPKSPGDQGNADATHETSTQNTSASNTTLSPMSGMTSSAQSPSTPSSDASPAFRLTLGDVGMAMLIGVITVLAVRNLPAVIELILLQHLPLDTASRYALVSVFRYALAIIGLTLAMSAMGISWSTVQWLAAALTFGLAFGLQEIFANFVSGLIILAERPIRVGDTVTVGDTEGTVTKIRMRATTLFGWDRKEMIIPNKTFITDRVINWTLSDPTQRIVVPVGVAYGSDLDKVERALLAACHSVPEALEDPAPIVLFNGFGDSTLNWEARIFIGSLNQLIQARTNLYRAIDTAFRRENIEIAFPQMDLHLRASKEFSELLRSGLLPPNQTGSPGSSKGAQER